MKNSKNENKNRRFRNFATIVYPESAPVDWIDRLDDYKIPVMISPLHDKDKLQKAENELKKPHYHVIIMFTSVKSEDQARDIINAIGGVGCEIIQSLRGYARYLCHLDNPDKYQYSINDIRCLCGADYRSIADSATDRYAAVKEMIHWCIDNDVIELSDLILYASEERDDWFAYLCDNSLFIVKEYLKSLVFKRGANKR